MSDTDAERAAATAPSGPEGGDGYPGAEGGLPKDEGSARETEEAAEVVEADLARMAAERDELRELAQRVQADFENYRKRVLREQTTLAERAAEGLVEQLLGVLDSFELALGSTADVDEQVRKGFELVYAELVGVLERAGLERIDTDRRPFDPELHDAVLHEGDDHVGEPVVVETLRTGYRFNGRVLRPAMVKVGRRGEHV